MVRIRSSSDFRSNTSITIFSWEKENQESSLTLARLADVEFMGRSQSVDAE